MVITSEPIVAFASALPGWRERAQRRSDHVRAGVARVPVAHLVGRAILASAVVAAVWIGLLLIFLPLVLTAYRSFFADRLNVFLPNGYTLSWYRQVLPTFGSSILTSVEIALLGVALAALLGVPAGIAVARDRFPGRRLLAVLLLAPLTVPGISLGCLINSSPAFLDALSSPAPRHLT